MNNGPITSETRVSLFDATGQFMCMWIGYKLPEYLAAHLNNERRYPNLNAAATYSIEWWYKKELNKTKIMSIGMPLGIAIQTELALNAELG